MTTLARPSTACFYSGNENMPACKQLGGTCIRMTGKRASPKERSCCSVCAQWLVAESLGNVVVVQAVSEGEEDAASLEEAEMTTSRGPACFYSCNENMPACKQLGGICIRMTGKRASPKERSCCSVCAQWLVAGSLGKVVVLPAMSDGEDDAVSLEEGEIATSRGPACFYSGNENMPACKQQGGLCIRMTGKRASPKERNCCSVCAQWLVAESLGEIALPQAMSEGEIPEEESVERQTPPKRARVCSADLEEGEIPGEKSAVRQTPPKRAKVCNMDA